MVSGLSSLRARGMSPEREASVVRALKRETSAAWFIDWRDESPERACADIVERMEGRK